MEYYTSSELWEKKFNEEMDKKVKKPTSESENAERSVATIKYIKRRQYQQDYYIRHRNEIAERNHRRYVENKNKKNKINIDNLIN